MGERRPCDDFEDCVPICREMYSKLRKGGEAQQTRLAWKQIEGAHLEGGLAQSRKSMKGGTWNDHC